jgi:hypothetical protein
MSELTPKRALELTSELSVLSELLFEARMTAVGGPFRAVKVDISLARERIREICKLLEGFDPEPDEITRKIRELIH